MPVSTLVVVGGWVLSPIIKELIGEVRSLVSNKYSSFKHFAKHLDQLVVVLDQIRTTVERLEAVQQDHRTDDDVSSGGMVEWVGQLVDAIHEVESVLDAFAYDDINMSNLRDNKVAQYAHFAARAGRRLIGRDKAFNRLKKLLEELPVIQQSLRDLALLPHAGSSRSLSRPVTGPLLPTATAQELFVGYEQEYDKLVSALLTSVSDQPSSSSTNNNVVAVIGHSGTGKTTIARRVWHDQRINEHFDLMVWVSVPDMFSNTDLLTEIYKSMPRSSRVDEKCAAAEMSFSKLQGEVQGLIASRRYLLLLDDVCNDESGHDRREKMKTAWEEALAPFMRGGQAGSRILMTSRAKICATTLGAGTRIPLQGIGVADLVLLLKKTAFGDARIKTPDLDDLIWSVAEQLRGLPSAAKAFGDKVRNNKHRKDWKKLLKKTINLAGSSSYWNLPRHLRSCLAFCSIFPDKWEFDPEMLVKMWIAHGIIGRSGGDSSQSIEDVGRRYVRELQRRSMLKYTSKNGRAACFVIDEQIHTMLLLVSATSFKRLGKDGLNRNHSIRPSVRHLSLTGGGCLVALAQLKDDPLLKKLRTLLVFDDGSSSSNTAAVIDNHVLKQLKAVIVVDFAGTHIAELPEGVGKLKHLRYLRLPNSVRSLPAGVTKLLHLQTLYLGKGCKLDDHGFPGDGMSNLINLRHLDMDMKYIAMIRGVGRLGNLQGSVEFCADRGKGHGMEELGGINSLHGTLTVKGLQAVAGKEEAQKAQLGMKEYLKALKLEWEPPMLGGHPCSTSPEQVLEGLQPHCKIEELHIKRYQGTLSPSWLESNSRLTSLSHLYLINCRNLPMLPCLSGLPELRVLHIKEMYSVARIDHSLYGGGVLRWLEKLVLDDMPNLGEWNAELSAFPRLQEIFILNCPKLVKLPPVPSTVRKMRIENVKNMRMENNRSYYLDMSFSSKSNSFTLDVHGDAVRLLHRDFLHQDHALAIRALSIKKYAGENEVNANHLSSGEDEVNANLLSSGENEVNRQRLGVFLESLQSLERLHISDCSEFGMFPEGAMPPSLKSIELKGCHPTLVEKLGGIARICSIALVHND